MMRAGRRRIIGAVVGIAAVCGALAGCGAPATSGGAAAPTSASAGAGGVVPLTVYSAQGYDSPVTKAFSAATGIPVNLVDDSTGPLLTKIAAERNNPQWGLLWVDGDTAFAAAGQAGPAARGRGYDHVVDVGPTTLTAVFAERARPRGARVTVAVDPAGCVAYPQPPLDGERHGRELTAVKVGSAPVDSRR